MAQRIPKTSHSVEDLLNDCKVIPKDLEECLKQLKGFMKPFVACLPREELRGHGNTFMAGLLSDLERKSTEPIAERAGQYRRQLQYFIGESPWDSEPLLDELNHQVAREMGSSEGVLIFDSSGFPKKGTESVGVARQWCGRLGKVDNCQVGVFMGYATPAGHTLVDERLYLPKEWARDKARRAKCHMPASVRFKTEHRLCLEMLKARGPQLPHRWITGDDAFGAPAWFRKRLRRMNERYLLEIPGTIGVCAEEDPPVRERAGRPRKAAFRSAALWKEKVPDESWVRITIRAGLKGPLVVWATRMRVRTRFGQKRRGEPEWLVVTRTEAKAPEVRYWLSDAGADVSLEEMVRVANARYWVEDSLERAKGEVGLAHYEVRSWQGWHHHMTLSLIALWFLVLEQRRLNNKTPAMTLQQSAHAVGEILRDPHVNVRRLARRITQRLKRNEWARIHHWRQAHCLPPPWTIARAVYVAQ